MKRQLQKIDPGLAEQATARAQQHPRPRDDLAAAEKIHQSKNNLRHQRNL